MQVRPGVAEKNGCPVWESHGVGKPQHTSRPRRTPAKYREQPFSPNAAFEGQGPGLITAWVKARHERRPRCGTKGGTRAEGPIHRLTGLHAIWCRAFSPFSTGKSLPWALPKAGMGPGLWPSNAAFGSRRVWQESTKLPRARKVESASFAFGLGRKPDPQGAQIHQGQQRS